MDDESLDNRTNSKVVKFDASKRNVDERLNRVIDQFSRNRSSYERDDEYDDAEVRRHGRGGSDNRHGKHQHHGSSSGRDGKGSQSRYDEEDDDDDDIVAMMDRMNKK